MIQNGRNKRYQMKVLFKYEEDPSTNSIANLAKIGDARLTHLSREIVWFTGQLRSLFWK